MSLRVLFYEPNATGHHFAYLGWMLPGFLELPVEVALATTPAATESEEFEKSIAPYASRIELLPICRPLIERRPVSNAWRRLADLQNAVEQWKPDHVCVAYADGLWQPLAVGATLSKDHRPTTEAWVFRGGFTYEHAAGVRPAATRTLWGRLIRRGVFTKVHVHDELLLAYSQTVSGGRSEVSLVADPIELPRRIDQSEARDRLGVPKDSRIVGCLGVADERKGVHLALRSLAELCGSGRSSIDGVPLRLLIAGPHSQPILELLATPAYRTLHESGSIVSVDRFLSKEEMMLAATACDVVLAPYVNHSGRSSIILWAAGAGRPVVGAAKGCIGHVIRSESLGRTCDVQDPGALANAIGASLSEPWTDSDISRVKTYAEWHSIESYQRMCSSFVRERCESMGA